MRGQQVFLKKGMRITRPGPLGRPLEASDVATAAFARGLREGFWGGRIWVMWTVSFDSLRWSAQVYIGYV